jgi:hypothetical protein
MQKGATVAAFVNARMHACLPFGSLMRKNPVRCSSTRGEDHRVSEAGIHTLDLRALACLVLKVLDE